MTISRQSSSFAAAAVIVSMSALRLGNISSPLALTIDSRMCTFDRSASAAFNRGKITRAGSSSALIRIVFAGRFGTSPPGSARPRESAAAMARVT
jgi:hypothetical protein